MWGKFDFVFVFVLFIGIKYMWVFWFVFCWDVFVKINKMIFYLFGIRDCGIF